MAFGLSFGMNKGKTSQQKTSLSTEDLSQIQSSDTQSTQVGSETQTGQSATSSTGTSSTGTAGSTTNTGVTSQDTTQKSQLFGDDILQGLSAFATRALGGEGKGDKNVAAGLDYLGNFDPDKFISQTLASARNDSDNGLQQLIYGLVDRGGGKGNTMVQKAAGQAQLDAAAKLAGVEAATTQTANNIVSQNTQLAQGITDSGSASLNAILSQLKGGLAINTGLANTTTNEAQNTQQQANTSTSEQQQQQTAQQSQSMQQLSQQIAQLLDSFKTTDISETLKGKTSSTGFGATA